MTNIEAWDRIAARQRAGDAPPVDSARYGPDGPTEAELRLLGDVRGKRLLDLGAGSGQAAIAFARAGATVIAVEASAGQLAHARRLAEHHEARVEWHQADLADLAFLRADSMDLAFCAGALEEVEDLDRAFRQIHRVLKAGGVFAFSVDHPFHRCTETQPDPAGGPARIVVTRRYADAAPLTVDRDGESLTVHPRSIATIFGALGRAGFRAESVVEPPSPAGGKLPTLLVWRARKEGI